jgi:hypothetical protein
MTDIELTKSILGLLVEKMTGKEEDKNLIFYNGLKVYGCDFIINEDKVKNIISKYFPDANDNLFQEYFVFLQKYNRELKRELISAYGRMEVPKITLDKS